MRNYWYFVLLTTEVVAGCEVEAVCNSDLDENVFSRLLGPEVQSIVRTQPCISELVNKAMNTSNSVPQDLQNRQVGCMSEKCLRD